MDRHLVDQPGSQELLHGLGAAADRDIETAGSLERPLERGSIPSVTNSKVVPLIRTG